MGNIQFISVMLVGACAWSVGCSVQSTENTTANSGVHTKAGIETADFSMESSSAKPCTSRPVTGSIYSVFASPEAYVGKIVHIFGYLAVIGREAYLFPSRDYADAVLPQMGISLGLSETFIPDCEHGPKGVPTLAGCDGEIVSATGCFRYDGSFSFGDLKGNVVVKLFPKSERGR